MTKTNIKNNIGEAYEKMIEKSKHFQKQKPITDKMVTKTLENLLKGIK